MAFDISQYLKPVADFPEPGITFQDISPLFLDPKALESAMDNLFKLIRHLEIDLVAGLDARGFLLAPLLARRIGQCGVLMIRKKGKLPGDCHEIQYNVEYKSGQTIQLQKGLVKPGQKVLIVDDILATGGTANATSQLLKDAGAHVLGIICLVKIVVPHPAPLYMPVYSLGHFDLDAHFHPSTMDTLNGSIKHNLPYQLGLYSQSQLPIIVLYHHTMETMARNLEAAYPFEFQLMPISWNRFPDGYYNIHFPSPTELQNRKVLFIGNMANPDQLLEQLSVLIVLPRQLIESLHIFFPYFGPGTMERIGQPGTLATADTLANFMSRCFPMTAQGPPVIHILDLHAEVARFYFKDQVIMNPLSAIPMVLKRVFEKEPGTVICFPDEGSYKRFRHHLASKTSIVVCQKIRVGDTRRVHIIDSIDFDFKTDPLDHVLIVDDLVQTGGTLDECRKALISIGAKKVSAFVTHAVFPNRSYRAFLPNGSKAGFDSFFLTDSNPEVTDQLKHLNPFEVIPLMPSLAPTFFQALHYQEPMRVLVASINPDKLRAVEMGLRRFFPNRELIIQGYSCDAHPDVKEQPIGKPETQLGATWRMNQVLKYAVNHSLPIDMWVAIESGIWVDEDDQLWKDSAYVELASNQIRTTSIWSQGTPVDSWMVESYLNGGRIGTIGQRLRPDYSSDWHLTTYGISRVTIMADAVFHGLVKMQQHSK